MTSKVRLATKSDMPELMRMARLFHAASGYAKFSNFGEKETRTTIETLIDAGTCIMGDGGAIGFLVFPIYMADNVTMSQELFWWVDEDKRGTGLAIRLLKEMERISKDHGASVCAMISLEELDGERVSSLYQKLGYSPKERIHMRCFHGD